ncbi:MAG: UPF0182 family protein [Nitrososphaerales archaeon]
MNYFEEPPTIPSRGTQPLQRVRLLFLALILLIIIFIFIAQFLTFYLNILEFGELYLRPIYFELVGGFLLALVAFFRIDFKNRRSIVWWIIRLALKIVRERGNLEVIPPEYFDFNNFRLSYRKFVLWQITKVLVGIMLFRNVIFGMVTIASFQGWDPNSLSLWRLLYLPFLTPPFDMNYAKENVIPMLPTLTLIVGPIFGALSIRLFLLFGITQIVRIVMPTADELRGGVRNVVWRVGIIEGLIAVALFWSALNSFFPSNLDYNTKYVIIGLIATGVLFSIFALRDVRRVFFSFTRRVITLRLLSILIIVLIIGSIIAVNNSIADARKLEWLGPYVTQQISVNRELAQLDEVEERIYSFGVQSIKPTDIEKIIRENEELLKKIRLWDWDAAFSKLKPEIGLIPYLDFQDSDILRFDNTLFWSASMKLLLPPTVRPEDRWYAEHLFYTNVPQGFLMLDAHTGTVQNTSRFFSQRTIYYGEGGLFSRVWAAFPADREKSEEIGGTFYKGKGGITIPPPLSWLFEINFLLAYSSKSIHIIRYRDVYDRIQLLFPYFQYELFGSRVDMIPVNDPEEGKTYWLMPLIIKLDTNEVPWSNNNPLLRLIGYALIDVYNGNIRIIVIGKDYFSELFKKVYSDMVETDVPKWLKNQIRYPPELFEWRVSMYDFYHVKDPGTFIVGKEFYEVPKGLDTYYIFAKPPGFEKLTYLGLLSLELRGAGGRNLAGYMVVTNDYDEKFGKMIFYQVPLDSPTKLLGPTAVLEALEKNAEFAQLKTLLRNPRIGEIILYRVGEQDVYFIPVYTAGAGGVVTEMGAVAVVGAAFTGNYYVGLSKVAPTSEEAFRNYLAELVGIKEAREIAKLAREEKLEKIFDLLNREQVTPLKPTAISPQISFLEEKLSFTDEAEWDKVESSLLGFLNKWSEYKGRLLLIEEGDKILLGFLINVNGIVEWHYLEITVT